MLCFQLPEFGIGPEIAMNRQQIAVTPFQQLTCEDILVPGSANPRSSTTQLVLEGMESKELQLRPSPTAPYGTSSNLKGVSQADLSLPIDSLCMLVLEKFTDRCLTRGIDNRYLFTPEWSEMVANRSDYDTFWNMYVGRETVQDGVEVARCRA